MADLAITPDHGIEFAGLGQLHEIVTVLLERLVLAFGVVGGDALVAAHLFERGEQLTGVDARVGQKAAGRGFRLRHREQQVLDREVLVFEALRVVAGLHQQLVQRLGDVDLALFGVAGYARLARQLLLRAGAELRDGYAEPRQQGHGQSVLHLQQGGEQVFAIKLLLRKADGELARVLQRLLRLLGPFV